MAAQVVYCSARSSHNDTEALWKRHCQIKPRPGKSRILLAAHHFGRLNAALALLLPIKDCIYMVEADRYPLVHVVLESFVLALVKKVLYSYSGNAGP